MTRTVLRLAPTPASACVPAVGAPVSSAPDMAGPSPAGWRPRLAYMCKQSVCRWRALRSAQLRSPAPRGRPGSAAGIGPVCGDDLAQHGVDGGGDASLLAAARDRGIGTGELPELGTHHRI